MIVVEDTGKGIKEGLPYIFDRFFKADRSRRYQSGNKTSYGIGLSLVKILVEVQGGDIEVYSKINRGTRFVIYFPIKTYK